MDVTNPVAITTQVQQLEAMARGLAKAYRIDLESALRSAVGPTEGTPFRVSSLTHYYFASSPHHLFYPLPYMTPHSGPIFPISKQAIIGSRFVRDEEQVFGKARTLLEQRGYIVYHELMVESHVTLIDLAREWRKSTDVVLV